MTSTPWVVQGIAVETFDKDVNDAALTITVAAGESLTVVLMLSQPVLAALLAELRRVDDTRAAMSGYGGDQHTPPVAVSLTEAVAAQPRHTFTGRDGAPLTDLLEVDTAAVDWFAGPDPWRVSLTVQAEPVGALEVDLNQNVLSLLLTDLRQLNAQRAVANGWADPDDTGDDLEEDGRFERVIARVLPGRSLMQDALSRIPDKYQVLVFVALVAVVIALIVTFS